MRYVRTVFSRFGSSPAARSGAIWTAAAAAICLIGWASLGGKPAVAQVPDDRCTVTFMQAAAPADTTVTSARMVQEPVARCKVEGYSMTTNPGPNKVAFGVQLPLREKWNNRFYFIGVGGSGGGAVPSDDLRPPRGRGLRDSGN